jgi:hypothetical protein
MRKNYGAILAVCINTERELAMKVICSWCRVEGRSGFVGEKAPLDDLRETHSICLEHETAVRARWAARGPRIGFYTAPTSNVRSRAWRTRRIVLSAMQFGVGLKDLASKVGL